MSNKLLLISTFLLSFYAAKTDAQTKDSLSQTEVDSTIFKTIEWEAAYICDAARNFEGGIKKGNAYMGLLNAGITIHSDKIWHGGSLNFSIMNTHGYNLSENLTGDLQVISNIENGDYTFIELLFYRQNFSKASLLVGLQDLNAEFCVTEYGGALTNSSFGLNSTFPLNFGAPIYPKTGLAAIVLVDIAHKIKFRTALFDGNTGSLEDDPHNLDWSITSEDGVLSITELEYKPDIEKPSGIKIGGIYHSSNFCDQDDSLNTFNYNWGVYGIIDQQIFNNGIKKFGIFGQIAVFPSQANFNTMHLGVGFNFSGIFKKRIDDCLAGGITYARIFDNTSECDLELNYSLALGNHIVIQPAIHYIINPGANQNFDNAFAGFIRLSLTK